MATESSGGTGLSGAGRHSGGGASDHFDLCIIGSGSGNTIVNHEFNDWSVAIVDQGVGEGEWFGGTCLNVGCIPTKMMVVPADFAASPDRAARLGVELSRG
ncbi:mycothione reductase, partial [Propionibacterium freudenreichii]|nr:mycothione reductase [Propionibacterium freudenreichii]